MERGNSLKNQASEEREDHQPDQEAGETASRPLLHFETESFSDSETASGHGYGFSGDSGAEIQPDRLKRFLRSAMSAGDGSSGAGQRALAPPGRPQASPFGNQPDASRDQRAHPGSGQPPRHAGQQQPERSPGASEAAEAATAAAAPLVAAAAAAAASGNAAAGRVYHALFRGAPRSSASASGTHTPDLAEPLVPGQDARSVCSDQGTERSGLLIRPRMSRPASHRALTDTERQAAAAMWERYRDLFVLWLCASALTLIISWWWFSLGILVSFTGVLGATSALRYQGYNKPSTELVKPAGGVQLLGVLTGLFSFCASGVQIIAACSVRCSHIEDCVKLRVTLVLLAAWFAGVAAISAACAYFAYGLLQLLNPTFYYRQSDVAVPEADNEMSPALLRQETFTPRASARMGSFEHESV